MALTSDSMTEPEWSGEVIFKLKPKVCEDDRHFEQQPVQATWIRQGKTILKNKTISNAMLYDSLNFGKCVKITVCFLFFSYWNFLIILKGMVSKRVLHPSVFTAIVFEMKPDKTRLLKCIYKTRWKQKL